MTLSDTQYKVLINKTLEECLIKPHLYHHICWGGGTVKIIDMWINNKKHKCPYKDISWVTPTCKACDGFSIGHKALPNSEEYHNVGMKRLATKLKKKLTISAAGKKALKERE